MVTRKLTTVGINKNCSQAVLSYNLNSAVFLASSETQNTYAKNISDKICVGVK